VHTLVGRHEVLAHARLIELTACGGEVSEVAAIVSDLLGGAPVVFEPGGPVGEPGNGGRAVRGRDRWTVSVTAGAEPLGTLVVQVEGELAPADQRVLEQAALVIAVQVLSRRNVSVAEARARCELLDDLIGGRMLEPEARQEQARLVGVDPEVSHVLVVARHAVGDRPGRRRVADWAAVLAGVEHGLATTRGGETILLLPGTDAGAMARQVAAALSARLGSAVTAGASEPISDLGRVADAWAQAHRTADAMVSLGRAGGAGAEDLGFVGLLLGEERDVGGFLESTLGPVLAYDARKGSALVHTLETYFGCGASLSRTAEDLHIHVNTVHQRLERIGRLVGADWQQPAAALELQLALRLHRLQGR
jgi:sugar diacid utilization regulator